MVVNRDSSTPMLRLSIGAALAALLSLASLHALSPEFDPSWRMVSEYANGRYGWVLSFMFLSWGVSSWALCFALWRHMATTGGVIGVGLLAAAGAGEAMASAFDINHEVMHNVAGALGVLCPPVAAILINVSLGRTQPWSSAKWILRWTAQLPLISVALMVVSFSIFIDRHAHSGVAGRIPKTLHPTLAASAGYANRLLIVIYCLWSIALAWKALQLRAVKSDASPARQATWSRSAAVSK